MPTVKTAKGLQVLKDRSVPLSQSQRSALIMFDGKRTVDAVLQATALSGLTRDDIGHLIDLGLLAGTDADAAPTSPMPASAASNVALTVPQSGERSDRQRYQEAYLLATQITASLGLRGFRLNLAVESAGNYEDLLALSPRIKEAVGVEKFGPLAKALKG